jgi:hypothetical protein
VTVQVHIEAIFFYPGDAIAVVLNQIVESPSPRLVSLPVGAIGFEFERVFTTLATDDSGEQRTFIQREPIEDQRFGVGFVYGRDDLARLDTVTAEGLARYLDEEDEDAVVMTAAGLFYPVEDDYEVVDPSQLRQMLFEEMPSLD